MHNLNNGPVKQIANFSLIGINKDPLADSGYHQGRKVLFCTENSAKWRMEFTICLHPISQKCDTACHAESSGAMF